MSINLRIVLLLASLTAVQAAIKPLGTWQPLVRTESWTEQWLDASGKAETRKVTAEVWTQAMQASLDAQGTLHIPARAQPYYLDGPLVLKSGQNLSADPTAEIRLEMQRIMQADASVFRTGESLRDGCQKLARTFASFAFCWKKCL